MKRCIFMFWSLIRISDATEIELAWSNFLKKILTALSEECTVPRCQSISGLSPTATSWQSRAGLQCFKGRQPGATDSPTKSYKFHICCMTQTGSITSVSTKAWEPNNRLNWSLFFCPNFFAPKSAQNLSRRGSPIPPTIGTYLYIYMYYMYVHILCS